MVYKPPLPFPVQQNATTVGPAYVGTITTSQRLAQITRYVELTLTGGIEHARVFRESSDAKGLFSCDVYQRSSGGRWDGPREETRKYENPAVPANAYYVVIDRIDFYTLHQMTPAEIEDHRTNLSKLLVRP